MGKSKPNHVILQLIVAFILTLLAAIYALAMLTDALKDEGAVKVLFLSLGSFALVAITGYIGYLIFKLVSPQDDEWEDS